MRGLVFEWVNGLVSVVVIERFDERGWVSERRVRGEVG